MRGWGDDGNPSTAANTGWGAPSQTQASADQGWGGQNNTANVDRQVSRGGYNNQTQNNHNGGGYGDNQRGGYQQGYRQNNQQQRGGYQNSYNGGGRGGYGGNNGGGGGGGGWGGNGGYGNNNAGGYVNSNTAEPEKVKQIDDWAQNVDQTASGSVPPSTSGAKDTDNGSASGRSEAGTERGDKASQIDSASKAAAEKDSLQDDPSSVTSQVGEADRNNRRNSKDSEDADSVAHEESSGWLSSAEMMEIERRNKERKARSSAKAASVKADSIKEESIKPDSSKEEPAQPETTASVADEWPSSADLMRAASEKVNQPEPDVKPELPKAETVDEWPSSDDLMKAEAEKSSTAPVIEPSKLDNKSEEAGPEKEDVKEDPPSATDNIKDATVSSPSLQKDESSAWPSSTELMQEADTKAEQVESAPEVPSSSVDKADASVTSKAKEETQSWADAVDDTVDDSAPKKQSNDYWPSSKGTSSDSAAKDEKKADDAGWAGSSAQKTPVNKQDNGWGNSAIGQTPVRKQNDGWNAQSDSIHARPRDSFANNNNRYNGQSQNQLQTQSWRSSGGGAGGWGQSSETANRNPSYSYQGDIRNVNRDDPSSIYPPQDSRSGAGSRNYPPGDLNSVNRNDPSSIYPLGNMNQGGYQSQDWNRNNNSGGYRNDNYGSNNRFNAPPAEKQAYETRFRSRREEAEAQLREQLSSMPDSEKPAFMKAREKNVAVASSGSIQGATQDEPKLAPVVNDDGWGAALADHPPAEANYQSAPQIDNQGVLGGSPTQRTQQQQLPVVNEQFGLAHTNSDEINPFGRGNDAGWAARGRGAYRQPGRPITQSQERDGDAGSTRNPMQRHMQTINSIISPPASHNDEGSASQARRIQDLERQLRESQANNTTLSATLSPLVDKLNETILEIRGHNQDLTVQLAEMKDIIATKLDAAEPLVTKDPAADLRYRALELDVREATIKIRAIEAERNYYKQRGQAVDPSIPDFSV